MQRRGKYFDDSESTAEQKRKEAHKESMRKYQMKFHDRRPQPISNDEVKAKISARKKIYYQNVVKPKKEAAFDHDDKFTSLLVSDMLDLIKN